MAPRDTPPAIIVKLNAATNAALQGDAMKAALSKLGAQPRRRQAGGSDPAHSA
jgi:hypothetical protein